MAKEEAVFFPAAHRLLTAEEWADIRGQITDPSDPVFHDEAALRLPELAARVRARRGAA